MRLRAGEPPSTSRSRRLEPQRRSASMPAGGAGQGHAGLRSFCAVSKTTVPSGLCTAGIPAELRPEKFGRNYPGRDGLRSAGPAGRYRRPTPVLGWLDGGLSSFLALTMAFGLYGEQERRSSSTATSGEPQAGSGHWRERHPNCLSGKPALRGLRLRCARLLCPRLLHGSRPTARDQPGLLGAVRVVRAGSAHTGRGIPTELVRANPQASSPNS